MANIDNPNGFHCIGCGEGGGFSRRKVFSKAAGYATAIFPGDLVNRVADGSIEASATPGTTYYTGVAENYGAASVASEHLVVVDPFALFVGQDDGSGSGTLDADYGLKANAVLGAGVALTLKSGHEIATSTKAVTATLDLSLEGPWSAPDNVAGVNRKSIVRINKHRNSFGVAGV